MQNVLVHQYFHTSNCPLLNVQVLMKILRTCHELHILVFLVLWCMPWFVLIIIYYMLWVWSVDTWIILVKNIGRLFSGFLGIFLVLSKLVWSLIGRERDLLAMWIHIFLLICIIECPLKVICLLLVIVMWVGGQLCNQLWPNVLLKQNKWLLLKHVKSLFGWNVCMLSFVKVIICINLSCDSHTSY
jgi:hypothetical protein